MRKSEDHMEVRGIDDFWATLVNPDFCRDCLAVGTGTVAAGIIMELCMAAFRTLADVYPEGSGFTVDDRPGRFFLYVRLEDAGIGKSIIRSLEYLPDLQILPGGGNRAHFFRQGVHLRSVQRDWQSPEGVWLPDGRSVSWTGSNCGP